MDFTIREGSVEHDRSRAAYLAWGPDLRLPDRFRGVVETDHGSAEIDVAYVEGRLEVRNVRLDLSSSGALRRADLALPLQRIAEELARRTAIRFEGGAPPVPGSREISAYQLVPVGELSPEEVPRRRRVRLTEEHYAKVARVYSDAIEEGRDPTRAVQEEVVPFGDKTPRSTASRWIKRARELGLLTKTWDDRRRLEPTTKRRKTR